MKYCKSLIANLITFFLSFHCFNLIGQDTIQIRNSSFEDMPRKGVPGMPFIMGWQDCGLIYFPKESPPDIHPEGNGAWGVSTKATDGETYLGLVIRENYSWELVGQTLQSPIHKGKCYSLTAYLSLSDTYLSGTAKSMASRELESFSHPVSLVIWGGHSSCDKATRLAVSQPVGNHDWKLYEFLLTPDQDYKYLILEAYYSFTAERMNPYNGHILVDGLSPLIEVPCR